MELIEKKYKLKQFLMAIYKPIIEAGNNIKNKEYIALFKANKDFNKTEFYNNIDDLIASILQPQNFYYNTYFNLATTNGLGRNAESQMTRTCIGLDFDRKKLGEKCNMYYIQEICKKNNLFYNAMVDSGHGFHIYIFIEPTNNIKLVQEVTNALIKRLNADEDANLTTQLLRVPMTMNVKDPKDKKRVNLVFLDDNVKRKNINDLAKFYITESIKYDKSNYLINNMNIKYCMSLALKNGTSDGERHKTLYKLVKTLQFANKTKQQILFVLEDWNSKCNPPLESNDLKNGINSAYESIYGVKYNCEECEYKNKCNENIEKEKDLEGYEVISTQEKIFKRCKKGAKKEMKGNKLIIYGILKSYPGLVSKEKIVEEITYEDKMAISEKTLRTTLKEMIEDGYLETVEENKINLYRLKKERITNEDLKIIIRKSMVYECIKGNITQSELQFYCFLCYLQNVMKRNDKTKGCLLKITQEEIAKEYGIEQSRVSKMLKKLKDEKYITIWDFHTSKRNGYVYYTYSLNY